MDLIRRNYKDLAKLLFIMSIVLGVLLTADLVNLNLFNRQIFAQHGYVSDDDVKLIIDKRVDGTSSWVKKGFLMDGREVTLNAQTIDGTLINNSRYQVKDWQLRVNINSDCYLNQAWCGKVEIHQNVLEDEKVQTLDLRNYSLKKVVLDYAYDGDLLIPLQKGDYLIYYPSEKDLELQVDSGSQLTIGLILYYLTYPDLTDYDFTYSYNRQFYEGYLFYAVFILGCIWILALVSSIVSFFTYRSTAKAMEFQKAGIMSMSEMYSVIYIIDVVKDELIPVVEDEFSMQHRPKHLSANEQLQAMFEADCEDTYKNLEVSYDFSTVKERLEERKTFAFEYESKTSGWRRIRFFAMPSKEGGNGTKILFTVQDINDEKAGIREIQEKISMAERESNAKSVFLANMSHEIRTPINTVIGFDTMILRESKDPAIRSYAKNINSAANMLLSLINGILDVSKLEADKMELVQGEYSFKQMIVEVVNMVKARTEFEKLDFICDISPKIADTLYGDSVRLKQIIINLITNAAKYTDQGSVKLSVFGHEHEGMMHLLVSVKDTGIGIKEEDLEKVAKRFQRFDDQRNHKIEGTGIGLNLVTGILALMDSELHVISKYGEGSEFYFELEQKVVDSATIGDVDFNADVTDDETYNALFVAPDAEVLVVDDNAMNLKVFTDLLKETELKIDTASSGAMSLKMAAQKKYDIIFMDHMMPEMDGVETFKHIREDKDGINAKTPVIILTANALKGAKEEYEQIGFDDFLAKPIQPDMLERMVLKHLDESKVKKNTSAAKKIEGTVSIPSITGVDATYGLSHTGGVSNYMSLLSQFGNVAASDLVELEGYAKTFGENRGNKEAVGSFRIKVHAMKASANILGALQVFGVAATLEELAAKEDVEGILAIFPYFSALWSSLSDNVKGALPEVNDKKPLPDAETLENLLHLLETSSKAYDIKSSDELLGKLKEFDWGEKKEELIIQLETAVANLDADKVVSICGELRL